MIKQKNNNYFIENKIKDLSFFERVYILPQKSEKDELYFDVLADSLFESTKNIKKNELAIMKYKLYDFKINVISEFKCNNIIFRIIFTNLNLADSKYQNDIDELTKLLLDDFYIESKTINRIVNDYLIYYTNLKNSPTNYAVEKFNDLIYNKCNNYLSYQKKIKELKNFDNNLLFDKIKEIKTSSYINIFQNKDENTILKYNNQNLKCEQNIKKPKINRNNNFIQINDLTTNNQQVTIQILYSINTKFDRYQLLLLNNIIGGDVNSKLFMQIREKHNLCYTIYSHSIECIGIKIFLEVDKKNIEQSINEIKKEIIKIQKGDILEFNIAKNNLIQNYQRKENNYHVNQKIIINNLFYDEKIKEIEDIIQKIENITKEEIISLSNNMILDKIYIY